MNTEYLSEDFHNFARFLHEIENFPQRKNEILNNLNSLFNGIEDYSVRITGNQLLITLNENGIVFPSTRLSDGTMRFLCMLIILNQPVPPSLIVIEEPEIGLHPDMLHKVADLLLEKSKETQIVVTTHSSDFLDAFSSQPESIMVCERIDNQTQFHRLDEVRLANWLSDYSLSKLWNSGEIGGTRW